MGAAQSNGSLFITSQTELKNISSKSDISLSNEVEELKEAVKNEVEFERIRYQSKHEE